MKRIAASLVLVSLVVLVAALSLAQTPPPGGPGSPPPGGPGGPPPGGPGQGMGQGMRGGNFAPPPYPGDTTFAERDSLMKQVMKDIAGKEEMPAESVFKDIQILKGRKAGDIPRVMNYGFGRALAVSCYFCHAKNDWAKDEKKEKKIARAMSKMVSGINADYISKIDELVEKGPDGQDRHPTVNCGTCHRGSSRMGGMGGARPGGPGGGPGGPR